MQSLLIVNKNCEKKTKINRDHNEVEMAVVNEVCKQDHHYSTAACFVILYNHLYISSCKPGLLSYLLQLLM